MKPRPRCSTMRMTTSTATRICMSSWNHCSQSSTACESLDTVRSNCEPLLILQSESSRDQRHLHLNCGAECCPIVSPAPRVSPWAPPQHLRILVGPAKRVPPRKAPSSSCCGLKCWLIISSEPVGSPCTASLPQKAGSSSVLWFWMSPGCLTIRMSSCFNSFQFSIKLYRALNIFSFGWKIKSLRKFCTSGTRIGSGAYAMLVASAGLPSPTCCSAPLVRRTRLCTCESVKLVTFSLFRVSFHLCNMKMQNQLRSYEEN